MSMLHETPPQIWSIILAGKEENSTPPFIEQWLGYKKPKSFCSFVGSRSMLQHTWDRADQLSHPNCKITVVGKSYLHETCSQLGGRVPGMILTEPRHFGMLTSLYLALTYLRTKAPDTIIVAYPSDHFIFPEGLFLKTIQRAICAAERLTDHVITVGVAPQDSAHLGPYLLPTRQLGWIFSSPIYAASTLGQSAIEDEREEIGTIGRLLNTSVIVARSEMLWKLGWTHLPFVMALFDDFREAIGTSYERAELKNLFDQLNQKASSLNALLHNSDCLAVMELDEVTWSNWETSDQIAETLTNIGKLPNFPIALPALTEK